MTHAPVIVWFRQDLRLADNPALHEAAESGAPILPIYIHDDGDAGDRKLGGASRFWRHHSLESFNKSLNGNLILLNGQAQTIITDLVNKTGAAGVYWNRCYEPWRIKRDEAIKKSLTDDGINVQTFNGSLLWEPWEVLKGDKTPYKVFTPFYKNGCLLKGEPRSTLPAPKKMVFASYKDGLALDKLGLLPVKPRWDKKMAAYWTIGEKGAAKALDDFLDTNLDHYNDKRNMMAEASTSHLSPRLHHGELSPNQIWHAAKIKEQHHRSSVGLESFLREIIWREFNYSLIYHFPTLPKENFQPRFNKFPWDKNPETLQAWGRGQTGYPAVDAAMRQMWETGFMHNRARLIVGSFLCKHLLLNWTDGEAWFWDCLCDADLANNVCNWQWVAGTGADAAPYFRIFNPVTQGEKFDPDGDYVRLYVPELAKLPAKYIHKPWDTPPEVLQAAGVTLGKTYPKPIVDHTAARTRALAAFGKTK